MLPQPVDQHGRVLPAGVVVAVQEPGHPPFADPAGLLGCGVVAKELQRDLAVHGGEQPGDRGVVGPKDLAELVLDLDLGGEQPTSVAGQRDQLGQSVGGLAEPAPAMVIVAEAVGERERVEGVVLLGRGVIALPQACRDSRVQRVDPVARREEPFDHQSFGSLHRDRQRAVERGQEVVEDL